MDAQWNDDFHHSVHVAMTSERFGYYADYTGVSDVARAMDQGFVYQGQRSQYRKRRHGAPSLSIDPSRYVVYVQNHDQVGNRTDAARLSSLVPLDKLLLSAALLLLSPGVPLLFMGEEYGETAPFTYFVDHGDPDLLDAIRRGRAQEHDGTRGDASDPADPATFDRAVLDHSLRTDRPHRVIWEHYCSLLTLRAAEPVLRHSSRPEATAEARGNVVILTRTHATTTIVAFFNLSGSPQSVSLPGPGCWEELLSQGVSSHQRTIELPPWRFRLFRSVTHEVAP
jgi:maltooligosyltrehalose trehalohydrolase